MTQAYILHAYDGELKGRTAVFVIGKTQEGKSFGIVENRMSPHLFIRNSDADRARFIIRSFGLKSKSSEMKTMSGVPVLSISAPTVPSLKAATEEFKNLHIETFEADIPLHRQFLIERKIDGPVRIEGESRPGKEVDLLFINPELFPGEIVLNPAVLSLDIETDPQATRITAISFAAYGPLAKNVTEEVHIIGSSTAAENHRTFVHSSEKMMLRKAAQRIHEIDSDILTGWNVIDFDMRVLARRFRELNLPFSIGRSSEKAVFLEGRSWGDSRAIVPGRQVLDAMHLVRGSRYSFDSYSLGTVAAEILGRGKLLQKPEDGNMAHVIEQTRQENPELFADYCLEDSRLVLAILEKTSLLELTLNRARLTGQSLERAWTSIAAFEFLYLKELHHRGFVAPTLDRDAPQDQHAAGGMVFSPDAGLHDHVFVFDFKSLYPSVIRTFNIDPLSLAKADASPSDDDIDAPNRSRFSREAGVLPQLLNVFFDQRAEAKQRADEQASYCYKIVMNSFYGVLGTRHCRFASGRLAGSITAFGRLLLNWCKDYLQKECHCRVLYGDTDSVFVSAKLPENCTFKQADIEAKELCHNVNQALDKHVRETWNLESKLELEYEKYYRRFLLPPARGSVEKGRAKGYAGLRVDATEEKMDIVGMEAVRRDWTLMAHELQRELLMRLFKGKSALDLEQFISHWVNQVKSGRMDQKLIYKKALRKPVQEYTKTTPPHVKAAKLLQNPGGVISYLITTSGPQPVGQVTAPIDYRHYIDKQIIPIVDIIAPFSGIDTRASVNGELRLF